MKNIDIYQLSLMKNISVDEIIKMENEGFLEHDKINKKGIRSYSPQQVNDFDAIRKAFDSYHKYLEQQMSIKKPVEDMRVERITFRNKISPEIDLDNIADVTDDIPDFHSDTYEEFDEELDRIQDNDVLENNTSDSNDDTERKPANEDLFEEQLKEVQEFVDEQEAKENKRRATKEKFYRRRAHDEKVMKENLEKDITINKKDVAEWDEKIKDDEKVKEEDEKRINDILAEQYVGNKPYFTKSDVIFTPSDNETDQSNYHITHDNEKGHNEGTKPNQSPKYEDKVSENKNSDNAQDHILKHNDSSSLYNHDAENKINNYSNTTKRQSEIYRSDEHEETTSSSAYKQPEPTYVNHSKEVPKTTNSEYHKYTEQSDTYRVPEYRESVKSQTVNNSEQTKTYHAIKNEENKSQDINKYIEKYDTQGIPDSNDNVSGYTVKQPKQISPYSSIEKVNIETGQIKHIEPVESYSNTESRNYVRDNTPKYAQQLESYKVTENKETDLSYTKNRSEQASEHFKNIGQIETYHRNNENDASSSFKSLEKINVNHSLDENNSTSIHTHIQTNQNDSFRPVVRRQITAKDNVKLLIRG